MNFEIIEKILSIIEKYGLSLTILIFLVVWLKPKIDTIWYEYSDSRSQRELTAKQSAAINVDNLLHFDLKVKTLLQELLDELECDWVQLWQFHNGVFSMGLPHIPFLYVSITHEVTCGEVMPMSMVYRSLPTTFFRDAGDRFEKEDLVITTLNGESGQVSRTFAIGALTNCLLPIRNANGFLAAIMSVGYAKTHEITDGEKLEMRNIAKRMAIYLATSVFGADELHSEIE